jgi:hypothetical protein
MTQPELADLIEAGFQRSEVRETLTAFVFKDIDQPENPTYKCCLLGAGLVELHGPESAWNLWMNSQPKDFRTLSAEQFGITLQLARDIAFDHQALPNARQAIMARLRANEYIE